MPAQTVWRPIFDDLGFENKPGDSDSTHKMTGVDKLHAEGIFGKGIKIGIIDSGVDYTHPNLGMHSSEIVDANPSC